LLALHHGQSQREVVVIGYIRRFDWLYRLKGSRKIGGSSVNGINCYCLGGCGSNIPYIFAYKGRRIIVYRYMWSSPTDITEDASAKIIEAPLTLIFKMG
jgi:hypothetical protein